MNSITIDFNSTVQELKSMLSDRQNRRLKKSEKARLASLLSELATPLPHAEPSEDLEIISQTLDSMLTPSFAHSVAGDSAETWQVYSAISSLRNYASGSSPKQTSFLQDVLEKRVKGTSTHDSRLTLATDLLANFSDTFLDTKLKAGKYGEAKKYGAEARETVLVQLASDRRLRSRINPNNKHYSKELEAKYYSLEKEAAQSNPESHYFVLDRILSGHYDKPANEFNEVKSRWTMQEKEAARERFKRWYQYAQEQD
ncbi:MAG: hypothetical protein KJ922_00485, partial [Nanoarchaeota archaeon]|nr:hypothetical protein [Nanoarchaeota archaeon]